MGGGPSPAMMVSAAPAPTVALMSPQTLGDSLRRFGCAAVLLVLGGSAGQAAGEEPIVPPVTPACISSPFGPRVMPDRPLAGTFHPGIDLPAPVGAPVRAVAPGTIIRIQRHGVGGLEMMVQHAGFIGVYSHLGLISPVILNGRMTVSGGQQLATVGRSGLTYGSHLYFGMIVDGRPVNPAGYLNVQACGVGPAQHPAETRPHA